jgi:Tfp pilus assembly protein PilX
MSDVKADPSKSKPSKEQKAAEAAERRRREAEDLRERRSAKLLAAESAVRQAEEALPAVGERIRSRGALADHLRAFYGEVDKLAKGNRQMEATDLTVEQANAIIRDAKTVVTGDVYLDRVKEFVPAGENPVYPDVLMVAATVQAAVRRAESALAEEEKRLHQTRHNARTIAAAARLILEDGEQPLKTGVQNALGEEPATEWFFEANDGEEYFDVERFDGTDAEKLFGTAAED